MDDKGVDGALIGVKQRVDPGTRKIIATRGDETVAREVSLTEGETREIVLPFNPDWSPTPTKSTSGSQAEAPKAPPGATGLTTLEASGIAAMATGGVVFAAGIATTFIALNHQSDLESECDTAGCAPSLHSKLKTFNTLKTVSTATLIGGAVLGATGAALYFGGGRTDAGSGDSASLGLFVRPSQLGLVGSF